MARSRRRQQRGTRVAGTGEGLLKGVDKFEVTHVRSDAFLKFNRPKPKYVGGRSRSGQITLRYQDRRTGPAERRVQDLGMRKRKNKPSSGERK